MYVCGAVCSPKWEVLASWIPTSSLVGLIAVVVVEHQNLVDVCVCVCVCVGKVH